MPETVKQGQRSYTVRTKAERRELLYQIWQRRLRSMTTWEIAQSVTETEKYGPVSQTTVRDYLKLAMRLNRDEITQLSSGEVANQFYLDAKDRVGHLWSLYRKAGGNIKEEKTKEGKIIKVYLMDTAEQRRCLEAIGKEQRRIIEIGQSMGVVPKIKEDEEVKRPIVIEIVQYVNAPTNGDQPADAGNGSQSRLPAGSI